jgi:hypothetical protein
MKLKRKIISGVISLLGIYCVIAYIFMWPPVVLDYYNWHTYIYAKGWYLCPPHASAAHNPPSLDACMNNLRQIDAAANQFAFEHHLTNGAPINFPDDLTPYIRLNSAGKIPGCPAGGVYSIAVVGSNPVCSISTNPTVKVRVSSFFYKITGPTPRYPHRLQ